MFQSEREAAGYLAGMIDGEGTVACKRYKLGQYKGKNVQSKVGHYWVWNRHIRIINTDYEIIEAILECCEKLAIHASCNEVKSPSHKRYGYRRAWTVTIGSRDGLTKVMELVPVRCQRKADRIRLALTTFKNTKRPSIEVLRSMYIDRTMSCREIARATGAKTSNTVRYWLEKYGIPLRSQSAATFFGWDTRRKNANAVA